jgi:hypothetical protein
MESNSGVDPNGGFREFMKKDPCTNIDVHRDLKQSSLDTSYRSNKWAVGTTKATSKMVGVNGQLNRSLIETKPFPRNPTDNIGFDPPANTRPFQKVFDTEMTKSKYNINVVTKNPWVPFHNT